MSDVDIVITWVDGKDSALNAKRQHYLAQAPAPLHKNAINPHRWVCSDELSYCLRSIGNNAPWVRRIWIVTDNQVPDISFLTAELAEKISIIDHKDIFAGYEDQLPTFNSLAIETMLWRIPGLAEHFLYFNDDVFLTCKTEFSNFFTDNGPVFRGKWVDYSHLPDCEESRGEASLLNHYNQIKSANMISYSADHIFASAHVVHPMQQSIMAGLFDQYRPEFIKNIGYRFRSTEQFLPQSLYNHACLKKNLGRIKETIDYIHIGDGTLEKWSPDAVNDFLASPERDDIKFLCINNLPEVESSFPNARNWIEEAIDGSSGQLR